MQQLINAEETARRLGITVPTLANWRVQRRGPNFVKFNGRSVRYDPGEVERFIASNVVRQPGNAPAEAAV